MKPNDINAWSQALGTPLKFINGRRSVTATDHCGVEHALHAFMDDADATPFLLAVAGSIRPNVGFKQSGNGFIVEHVVHRSDGTVITVPLTDIKGSRRCALLEALWIIKEKKRMIEEQKKSLGLYDKYKVTRADGSDKPGGKHEKCALFVLDMTHDPFARIAALAYADACEKEGYDALARDLRARATSHPDRSDVIARLTAAWLRDPGNLCEDRGNTIEFSVRVNGLDTKTVAVVLLDPEDPDTVDMTAAGALVRHKMGPHWDIDHYITMGGEERWGAVTVQKDKEPTPLTRAIWSAVSRLDLAALVLEHLPR